MMKNLKDIEKAGRQAWLATLGTYAKGWEIISDKVPLTFDDASKFVNDLIDEGEKIETDLKEKVKSNNVLDEKIAALKVKLGVETRSDDKLAELNQKVDALTDEIEKLVDARLAKIQAEQAKAVEAKPAEKAPAKKPAAKKPAAKAEPAAKPAAKTTRARKTPVKAPVKAKTTNA